MSEVATPEALVWAPPTPATNYSVHARDYSICRVYVQGRWTYECWKGREQLKVGLLRAAEAKAWCQRHHDTGGASDAAG